MKIPVKQTKDPTLEMAKCARCGKLVTKGSGFMADDDKYCGTCAPAAAEKKGKTPLQPWK